MDNKNQNSIGKALVSGRFWLGVALSAFSGILLYVAFPPFNVGLLIFIALVPLLIAQYRLFPRKLSALGPALANLVWLWPFLYRIFNIDGAPFYIQHLGLLVTIFTFFTSSERLFNELTGYKWFILQGIAAYVGFEMIRSFIPFLGTMGFAANPLASQPWLIQPISIFNIYGMSLVVILVNFTLAQLIMLWIDKKWVLEHTVPVEIKATRKWAAVTAAVVVAWIGISLVIYFQPPTAPQTTRVAALHMYLDGPGHQIDDAETEERLARLRSMALEAADQGAEVIYVPEMAFGFNPQKKHTEELRSLAIETDAYIYFVYAYHLESEWHNEAVLISPSGEFSPVYGKQHAFGEPPTTSSGTSPVHNTPYGVLGTIICMDGVFTNSARQNAGNGAQILGIPTYNSTVGISEQNWTHFVMRSVENQVPVVNTDRGFYTMIIDAHGTILADERTPEGSNQVVVVDVPLSSGEGSFYTKLGVDWMGWISLAVYVFFMVFQGVVEKRAKQAKAS